MVFSGELSNETTPMISVAKLINQLLVNGPVACAAGKSSGRIG